MYFYTVVCALYTHPGTTDGNEHCAISGEKYLLHTVPDSNKPING